VGRLSEGPEGWIGVDFDRTLAYRTHDSDKPDVGSPVPAMVDRVKRWLAEGKTVKILAARVGGEQNKGKWGTVEQQKEMVEQWCLQHIGQILPVTCQKDGAMIELWDDSVVAVEENTGRQLSPSKVDGVPPGTQLSDYLNAKLLRDSGARQKIGVLELAAKLRPST